MTNRPLVLEARELRKTFRSYKKKEGVLASLKGFWSREHLEVDALKATNLTIHQGELVGLVGSNGAGKTTLIKLLSGLIHPSSGTVEVLGHTPWKRQHSFLRKMSLLLGQKNQLWWDISPQDSFGLLNEIYDLKKSETKAFVQKLARELNCEHVLNVQLRRLSLGERMKMELIGSLLHRPQILFLDEPTIGLDIVAQTSLRDFLRQYCRETGTTMLLTSHAMSDIQSLADRLLLISKGALVFDGTVTGFMGQAVSKNQISFVWAKPLTTTVKLLDLEFLQGAQESNFSFPKEKTPMLLSALFQHPELKNIQNLKIEEADFEDIIHAFLQKELGPRAT